MVVLDILGQIGFDWKVALANLVNFLVIFWLLKRYAFPKIAGVLEERKQKIQDGIDNAQKAETELLKAEQHYNERLQEGKGEAHQITLRAHEEEKRVIAAAEDKAREAAAQVKQDATEAIEGERKAMEQELKSASADLVVAGLERVLKKELTVEDNKRIIASITS